MANSRRLSLDRCKLLASVQVLAHCFGSMACSDTAPHSVQPFGSVAPATPAAGAAQPSNGDRGSGMGIGLGGMRERVRELGGVLRIEPAEPSGTAIVVVIPLIEGQKRLLSVHPTENSAQNAASRMAASGS